MRRVRGGFTLIELILVMALLFVVLGLSAPQLATFFKGRSLDSEARRFLALTRYAKSRAASEGIPVIVWIDRAERKYGIEVQPGFTRVTEDRHAAEYTLERDLEIEADELSVRSTAVPVSRSSRENVQAPVGNLPTLVFMPDGFMGQSSPEAVVLREKNASEVWIVLSRNRLNYEIETNNVHRVRR